MTRTVELLTTGEQFFFELCGFAPPAETEKITQPVQKDRRHALKIIAEMAVAKSERMRHRREMHLCGGAAFPQDFCLQRVTGGDDRMIRQHERHGITGDRIQFRQRESRVPGALKFARLFAGIPGFRQICHTHLR